MQQFKLSLRAVGAFSVLCVLGVCIGGCGKHAEVTSQAPGSMPVDGRNGASGPSSDPKDAVSNPNVPNADREKIRQMMSQQPPADTQRR